MEQTVEQKLKALYELQTLHTKIDKIPHFNNILVIIIIFFFTKNKVPKENEYLL